MNSWIASDTPTPWGNTPVRKWVPPVLKLLLSTLFVVILARLVEPRSLLAILNVPPVLWSWWAGALLIQGLVLGLQALSWQVLFSTRGSLSFPRALGGSLVVSFAGIFTPGRFSARLSAPWVFQRLGRTGSLGFSAAIVYVQTACYLTAYGLAAAVGVLLLVTGTSTPSAYLFTAPVALYLITGGGLLYGLRWLGKGRPQPPGGAVLREWLPSRWTGILRDHADHLARLSDERRKMTLAALLLLVTVSLLPGLRVYLLCRCLGLEPPAAPLMFLLPAFYSVTILPVSFGGLGLAEGSAIGGFILLGAPPSLIFPVVLLDRALAVYLPALAGWCCFLFGSLERDGKAGGNETSDGA